MFDRRAFVRLTPSHSAALRGMASPTANVHVRVQALVSHCEQWVGKLSLLLHELASAELADLYAHFAASTAALRATPRSLDELAQVVTLQKKLDAERPTLAARFEPLGNMFATLEKVRRLQYVSF